mmetsp:Transcript_25841/g.35999  ORF Transcript_25841/g.35999 Transcript_25841/m.35999 type:complete len:266 (-) Transcript_25841:1706-2503(-)
MPFPSRRMGKAEVVITVSVLSSHEVWRKPIRPVPSVSSPRLYPFFSDRYISVKISVTSPGARHNCSASSDKCTIASRSPFPLGNLSTSFVSTRMSSPSVSSPAVIGPAGPLSPSLSWPPTCRDWGDATIPPTVMLDWGRNAEPLWPLSAKFTMLSILLNCLEFGDLKSFLTRDRKTDCASWWAVRAFKLQKCFPKYSLPGAFLMNGCCSNSLTPERFDGSRTRQRDTKSRKSGENLSPSIGGGSVVMCSKRAQKSPGIGCLPSAK